MMDANPCILLLDEGVVYDHKVSSLISFLQDSTALGREVFCLYLNSRRVDLLDSQPPSLGGRIKVLKRMLVNPVDPAGNRSSLKEALLSFFAAVGPRSGVRLGVWICAMSPTLYQYPLEAFYWVLYLVGYDIAFVRRLLLSEDEAYEVPHTLSFSARFANEKVRELLLMALAYLSVFNSGRIHSIAKKIEEAIPGRYGDSDTIRKALKPALEDAYTYSLVEKRSPRIKSVEFSLTRFGRVVTDAVLDRDILDHLPNDEVRGFVNRIAEEARR